MSFDAAVPLNSDSPSIFPAQNQTNMARLQTLLGADHQFNLSAAADDGYHNVVHLTQQAPSGALAATGRFYAKTSASRVHAFYMDSAGAEYQLTPSMPIRAAVNFQGNGAVGACPLRSQYNVASVSKTADGSYTVNFTTAMPNNNYIVLVTGMRTGSNSVCNGCVASANVYGDSMATTFVRVAFYGQTDTRRDAFMGNVVILSVT
jgi:hypothetical protein